MILAAAVSLLLQGAVSVPASAEPSSGRTINVFVSPRFDSQAEKKQTAKRLMAGVSPGSIGLKNPNSFKSKDPASIFDSPVTPARDDVRADQSAARTAVTATGETAAAPSRDYDSAAMRSMTREECLANAGPVSLPGQSPNQWVKSRFAVCNVGTFYAVLNSNGAPVGSGYFTAVQRITVPSGTQRVAEIQWDFFGGGAEGLLDPNTLLMTPSLRAPIEPTGITWQSSGNNVASFIWNRAFGYSGVKLFASYRTRANAGEGYTGPTHAPANHFYGFFTLTLNGQQPGFAALDRVELATLGARWDNASYLPNYLGDDSETGGGVTLPYAIPLEYSLSGNEAAVAQHVRDACENPDLTFPRNGTKSVPGCSPDRPLHRLKDSTRALRNRAVKNSACIEQDPDYASKEKECDEFPFASVYEGAAQYEWTPKQDWETNVTPDNWSARPIPSSDNQSAGGLLGDFYTKNRILDTFDDGFWVKTVGTDDGSPEEPPVPASPVASPAPGASGQPGAAMTNLDLSNGNRRAQVAGLPDWRFAGYQAGGAPLPGESEINTNAACDVTAQELAGTYGVVAGDGADDTGGLQQAIDYVKAQCSPTAFHNKMSRITLPAGVINVSRQISVDADFLLLRGAGADPQTGTRFVFRPDENTRYDTVLQDGTMWDKDAMTSGPDATGGWIWPGRGLFRVQSRDVHPDYLSDYNSAPANRKDLFEGTVNVHWKAGVKLRSKPGDTGFAARAGDKVVYLDSKAKMTGWQNHLWINIRAANTRKFYDQQQAVPTEYPLQNMHMRQQIFRIDGIDTTAKTVTLLNPLEFDVPVNSTSDGSEAIDGKTYDSKASPLVDPVLGVGFEDFSFTQDMPSLNPADAVHNYGNMAPAYAMHGIVFKWAVNSYVRGVRADMVGSHPIVTEEAAQLSIINNQLNGSWNKGKGGNGYFRGSRVWNSVFAGNTTRNLRHFTLQWSASGNVVIGNSFDSDLNLHGGWERNNLFELNSVAVPFAHRSGNCLNNCGDEVGSDPDDATWYPIWWGAGKKAVKWSGSSGPQNVFFNNEMLKEVNPDSDTWVNYYPVRWKVYQFGWDGAGWQHLSAGQSSIRDWQGNELRYYGANSGVDDTLTDDQKSLFLNSVPTS
ncbi:MULTISPECIES: NucA/NucB deoxyribonuclease domain-containing protein [Streptomyces]|uniref:Deoxyribonuclease NucA/NucB domain-containing protein n=2 Tax=Streptomyces TaxID=1883 RepID=A0ABV9IWT1_9ACTN